MRSLVAFFVSTAVFSFAMGCATSERVSRSPASIVESPVVVTDPMIEETARGLFMEHPLVSSSDIVVSVSDRIVTLSGEAPHLLAKQKAVALTKALVGVRSIIDLIDVQPKKVSDADLKAQIIRAWKNHPVLERYKLDAHAQDGRVLLRGQVDSWAEKELAEEAVLRVAGVRDLNNEIDVAVASTVRRSDQEIEPEIESRLKSSIWFGEENLHVDVNDGAVQVSGEVESLLAREKLYDAAWVVGVKSVDVTGVDIRYGQGRRAPAEDLSLSDLEIEHFVRQALQLDPRVRADHVDVIVEAGLVILDGEVGSLLAKRAAGEDATNSVGVWKVSNELKVRPQPMLSDQVLEKQALAGIKNHPILGGHPIEVRARRGTLVVEGQVPTFFEKLEAENVLENIPGVQEIENQIVIE